MQQCHLWCAYKIQIQILNCQISPGLTQPANLAASTTLINHEKLFDGSADHK